MRAAGVLLALLAGCPPVGDKHDTDDTSPPPDPVTGGAEALGQAAWDPVLVGRSDGTPDPPEAHDADGTAYAYTAVLDAEGDPITTDEDAVFQPVAELPVGLYTVAQPDDVDVWTARSFEVLPYGLDTSFDAASVAGVVYGLTDAAVLEPRGLGDLADPYIPYVRLQLLSVEGGQARFRLIFDDPEVAPACEVLRASGALSETGRLTWSLAEAEAATTPEPTPLRDLSLDLGFLGDGSAVGGARGTVTADVRNIRDADGRMAVCDLLDSFDPCWDCLGDGEASCASFAVYAGVFVPVDATYADELPSCGLDTEAAGEALSCEWDGGVCAAGVFAPFLGLAAVRRRKRGVRAG